jgi:hypothetical protein
MKYNGYKIKIEQDDDPANPRKEFDNLGTLVCWHRRYNLGDENLRYYDEETIEQITSDENIFLPVYIYDHSGITINTNGFHCPWDSGQVGWIYVSKDVVRKEYNWSRITQKRHEQIEQYLKNEIAEYDQYLTEDVWYYLIKKDGEIVESCGGFYGHDYCEKEAKEMVDWLVLNSH